MDNNTTTCGVEPSESQAEFQKNFEWWIGGVVLSSISGIGISGNSLFLVSMLSLPSHRRTLFYKLLMGLAVSDMLFIFSNGLICIQQAFGFEWGWAGMFFPTIIFPLAGFSMTASSYAGIAISMERCLGICYPDAASRFRKIQNYIFFVVGFCLIIDTPRFLEIEEKVSNVDNTTIYFGYTDLRKNPTYSKVYYGYYRLIMTIIVPFVSMFYCNVQLYCHYKRNCFEGSVLRSYVGHKACIKAATAPAVSFRASYRLPLNDEPEKRSFRRDSRVIGISPHQDKHLFHILFWVSIMFLICHSPRLVLNAMEFGEQYAREKCKDMGIYFFSPRWIVYMRCIEKIALIANASFNFLFYALFGSDLRNHMKKCLLMIVCKKKARRFSRWSSRTSSKISNLSSKTNRNRSNLSVKKDEKILYDIDENEENDVSQDDSRPPFIQDFTDTTERLKEEKNEKDEPEASMDNGNAIIDQESYSENNKKRADTITTICLSYSDYESKPTTIDGDKSIPSVINSEKRSLSEHQILEEIEEKTFKLSNSNYHSIDGLVSSSSSIQKIKNTHAIIIFNHNLFLQSHHEKGYGVVLDESNGSTEYLI